MQQWKTLSRHVVLEHSKYLTVENHEVELPDGRVIPDWPWIITPDFVNVLAVTDEGKFVCFRQTKYAVDGTSLAPVGGYMEPGEDPLAAAKRELLEEAGCEASDWTDLGQYRVDSNRGAGTAVPEPFRARRRAWSRRVQGTVVGCYGGVCVAVYLRFDSVMFQKASVYQPSGRLRRVRRFIRKKGRLPGRRGLLQLVSPR